MGAGLNPNPDPNPNPNPDPNPSPGPNRRHEHAQAEAKKHNELKVLGVDLTAYLVAQATLKPDAHWKIETSEGGSNPNFRVELPPPNGLPNGKKSYIH